MSVLRWVCLYVGCWILFVVTVIISAITKKPDFVVIGVVVVIMSTVTLGGVIVLKIVDLTRDRLDKLSEQAQLDKLLEQAQLDKLSEPHHGKKPKYCTFELWLMNDIVDVDSLTILFHSIPQCHSKIGWVCYTKYTYKNVFGGIIERERMFAVSNGVITSYEMDN